MSRATIRVVGSQPVGACAGHLAALGVFFFLVQGLVMPLSLVFLASFFRFRSRVQHLSNSRCAFRAVSCGFAVSSPEQAHAWHEAGIAAGGTPIEDDPGIRSGAGVELYLAYLRDPDGNKICAMHRLPAKS